MDYDVIIVGAGPAGIFAALTLADMGVPHVLLLEKGKDLSLRRHHSVEDRLCGWGGAGAFSDGKLTLSIEVGGALGDYIGRKDLHALLERTDGIYVAHGAPDRIFGGDWVQVEALADQAKLADLELIPDRIRHIGTENCRIVLERFRASLAERIEIHTETEARDILVDQGRVEGVRLADGRRIHARFVVAAPGRSGARWMKEQAAALGLRTRSTSVDIGVRVELPAPVLKAITDATYESKLVYYSKTFDEKVRTFCMNPYGEVVTEENNGIISVNGHSYAEKRSENTNFAILVSSFFTEPFDDPIAYGRDIAGLANLLGGGVIIQRLGDLLAGRRSTPKRIERCLTKPTLRDATPGDLSFVFPYRHLLSIIEMLQALDRIAPGVYSRHTLLYGVEVKFYSNRTDVTAEMETAINNLFVIGDGAGITRGPGRALAHAVEQAEGAAV
ncbi:MAG: FAD-dependent oxidoreductase, partial [Candidatus Desulfacyla sp.]